MVNNISKQEVIEKANLARDRFVDYISSLLGNDQNKRLSSQEISLFDLRRVYDDGQLRSNEVNHIKNNIRSLNFEQLVEQGFLSIDTSNKVQFKNQGQIDFNKDGLINDVDNQQVNYILNFDQSSANILDEILNIADNEDQVAEFHIRNWANERGLTGSKYNDFYNKFLSLYQNTNFNTDINTLSRLLKLYDAGLGKEDISQLDSYWKLIYEDQPLATISALYRFERSPAFNVEDKVSMRNYLIEKILGENSQQSKLVSSALKSFRMPVTGGKLNATGLKEIVDAIERPEDLVEINIQNHGKKLGLSGNRLDTFTSKFFQTYYQADENDGNSMQDISNLVSLYRAFSQKNDNFDINKLDVYAQAMEDGIPFSTIKIVYKFETDSRFNLTDDARENKLNQYFNILADKKSKQGAILKSALKTNKVPITGEPLSIDKLDDFLSKSEDDKAYAVLNFKHWAEQRDIFNKDAFVDKFSELYDLFNESTAMSKLANLLRFYDSGVRLDDLNHYADALDGGVKASSLRYLQDYLEDKDSFDLIGSNKSDKLVEYINILKEDSGNNSRDKKVALVAALKAEKLPFTNLPLNRTNLDDLMSKISEDDGQAELQIRQFARLAGLEDSPDRNDDFDQFVNELVELYKEEDIGLSALRNLSRFYRDGKLTVTQLKPYAHAMNDGVKLAHLNLVYKFETSDNFDLLNADRDNAVNRYINILRGDEGNSDTIQDKKRVLINSIKSGKLYIKSTPTTASALNHLLDIADNEDDFFELHATQWAEGLGFRKPSANYNAFIDKFTNLKKDSGYSNSKLTNLMTLYRQFPDLELDELDHFIEALDSKAKFGDVAKVAQFITGDNFSLRGAARIEKTSRYLSTLIEGKPQEKQILVRSIGSGTISLTQKDLNINNLEEALNIAQDDDQLIKFNFKKIAKGFYKNNVSQTNIFMSKFYDDLYVSRGMEVNKIRNLISLHKDEAFNDDEFNKVTEIIDQGTEQRILFNFKRYANAANLNARTKLRYLDILLGAEGSKKKTILESALRTKFIPIANRKLF